jgi:hypothetical protein
MKLALIPPRISLINTQNTGYHLLLPEHADDAYYESYYNWRRACGDFLMLDNGIAEGKPTDPEDLLGVAFKYMVNEVVVPDVLCDMKATIQAAWDFEQYADEARSFNYMGVVQGSTLEELLSCMHDFAVMEYIDTLAIPRHVETTVGFGTRLRLVEHAFKTYDKEIHLLGTNPRAMSELRTYAEHYRLYGVRGIDTASPYYYAMAGQFIIEENHVARPEGYYDDCNYDEHLAQQNVAVVKAWVYGN